MQKVKIFPYKNKKVLVVGMAKSGVHSALLLRKLGAVVTVADHKTAIELGEPVQRLHDQGIETLLGAQPDAHVKDFSLIVVSPGVPTDLNFFSLAKSLGIPVIGEIELSFWQTPCPVLAVTGTNGKTTTTTLLGEMMQAYIPETFVVGNIGTPYSSCVSDLTAKSVVVAEISSFQLETVKAFAPHIAIMLNITHDHLNRHKTVANYIKEKEKIFTRQKATDFLILNADDAIVYDMRNRAESQIVLFSKRHTVENGVYLQDRQIWIHWSGQTHLIIHVNELLIPGAHNLENIMAAAMAAFLMGAPIHVISGVLRNFKGVPHRLEYVTSIDGIDYYNDSKATNTEAALRAVAAIEKPIILLAGGYDKGQLFDDFILDIKGKIKKLVLFGQTAKKIETCALTHGLTNIEMTETLEAAVMAGKKSARPGDCILLSPACASWDQFQNFEERGDLFKECVLREVQL